MIKWLKSKFSKPRVEVRYRVIARDVSQLTMAEFCSNPELTKKAREIFANPFVRLMLDVCRNSSPANHVILVPDIHVRAVHQAQTEGYHIFMNNFESLAVDKKPETPLEAEFAQTEEETETN